MAVSYRCKLVGEKVTETGQTEHQEKRNTFRCSHFVGNLLGLNTFAYIICTKFAGEHKERRNRERKEDKQVYAGEVIFQDYTACKDHIQASRHQVILKSSVWGLPVMTLNLNFKKNPITMKRHTKLNKAFPCSYKT